MTPSAALRAAVLLAALAGGADAALAADPAAASAPPAPPAQGQVLPEPPGGTGPVRVEAGETVWHGETGLWEFRGGVVARRGAITLRARAASLDPATDELLATGDVVLADPTRVIAADEVRAVLDGPFHASGVVAYLKESPTELGGVEGKDQARVTGRNRLSFTGKALDGDAEGHLRAEDMRVSLCDCGPGQPPSWELRASRADVIPGDRVVLDWPVLYVTPRLVGVKKPVPVLVVPWMYLPLGDRHTGLLATQINSTGATGFSLAQPLFVTLGRSADTTITPEYMFGRSRSQVEDGKPAVRGFGARLELRWAPADGAEGQIEAHGVNDLDDEPSGAGGGRLSLIGYHTQRLGDSTRLRVAGALSTDPVWYRDFTSDVLLKGGTYARSQVLVSHKAEAWVLEGTAAYYQPLTPEGWTTPHGDYGTFGGDVPVAHRWPSLAATLLPVGVGPFLAQGRAGLARFATLSGEVGELGPGDPGWLHNVTTKPGMPGGEWRQAHRPAVNRADARLQLSWPMRLGGALSFDPFVRGVGVGYLPDDGESAYGGWAAYGASASFALSRSGGGLEHRIEPRVEYLGGTAEALHGEVPLAAGDQWDRLAPGVTIGGQPVLQRLSAAPPEAYQQLRLALVNRLDAGAGGHLQLELAQDLDLRRGTLAETTVRGSGAKGPLLGDLDLRFLPRGSRSQEAPPAAYDSPLDRFTQLRGSLGLVDRRGDEARATLVAVGPGGSGINMAGPDALFDLRPAAIDGVSQGTLALRGVLGGATLGYDALVPARPLDVARCTGSGTRKIEAWHIQQHAATMVWNSPCRCFVAKLVLRVNDCGDPSYSATIDLSQLMERATIR
ncbi:MAG: LPS-assembly protein LptD [Anaeromyxobacter sp.]